MTEIKMLQARVNWLEEEPKHTEECCVQWATDYGNEVKKTDALQEWVVALEAIEQQQADNIIWQAGEIAKHLDTIEAIRKQEPAFWLNEIGQMSATKGWAERYWPGQKLIPLYAAPVVAPDVLREVLEALKLCYEHCRVYHPEVERNNVGLAVRKAIDAAITGGQQ